MKTLKVLTNLKSRNKLLFYPILVFIILLFCITLLKNFQKDTVKLVDNVRKTPLETLRVYPKDINPEFLFFGKIVAKNKINVVSRLSGKVLYVSEKLFNSKQVKKNEILFKLDAFEYEQDLIKKKSFLEELKMELDKTDLLVNESKKQLELANVDYNRKKKLYGNTVSQKALDDAELKVSKANAKLSEEEYKINSIKINIKKAKANLKVAYKNLSFTNYRAPFSGKIANSLIDIGSEVKSGEALAKLINTSELEVKFFVGEKKFTELATNKEIIGKKIKIKWKQSNFNKVYEAKLIKIDSIFNEELSGLNMYAKIIDISDNDPIRPGVFVEVLLQGNSVKNAILIPEDAVYEGKYVYILKNNKPNRVEITVQGFIKNKLIITGNFLSGSNIILTRLDNFQGSKIYYSISK